MNFDFLFYINWSRMFILIFFFQNDKFLQSWTDFVVQEKIKIDEYDRRRRDKNMFAILVWTQQTALPYFIYKILSKYLKTIEHKVGFPKMSQWFSSSSILV